MTWTRTLWLPMPPMSKGSVGVDPESGRPFPHAKGYSAWERLALAVLEHYRPRTPVDSEVRLSLLDVVARPKGHLNAQGEVRPGAPARAGRGRFPDFDKSPRAVADALQKAGWLTDDKRVDCADYQRVWARPGEPGRQRVSITCDGPAVGFPAQGRDEVWAPTLAQAEEWAEERARARRVAGAKRAAETRRRRKAGG